MKSSMKNGKNSISTTSLLALTFALSLTITSGNSWAEVFKTVDESGQITFTDQPNPGADKVLITEPNTVKSVNVPAPAPATWKGVSTPYSLVSINSPQNDSAIINRLAGFTVSTTVKPQLTKGHQLELSIDGKTHSKSLGAFTVNSIGLGTHSLQVAVIDEQGNTLITSAAITIYARQPGG